MKELKITDLTELIIPPSRPLHPDAISHRVRFEQLVWPLETYQSEVDDSTYQLIKFKSHLGTHVEAPVHKYGDHKSLMEFHPGTFLGHCWIFCFDIGENEGITMDLFTKKEAGRLQENDLIILYTTFVNPPSDRAGGCPNAPLFSNELAEYLVKKKVKMVGMDYSMSMEPNQDGMNAHDILLDKQIPLLEGLQNLRAVKSEEVFLVAVPGLNIKGIDSSPTRALAIEGMY